MITTCEICGALTNKPKKHKKWHDNFWRLYYPIGLPTWPGKPTVTWTNTTSTNTNG